MQGRNFASAATYIGQQPIALLAICATGAQLAEGVGQLAGQWTDQGCSVVSLDAHEQVVFYKGKYVRVAITGPWPGDAEIAGAVLLRGIDYPRRRSRTLKRLR